MNLYDAARAMGVTFTTEAVPQDRFVTADGRRFHYLEWGEPDSPPMLLLHGYAQTCHSWDFVSLAMCDRFRVLSLDQRGHGDTDWAPDSDYSPEGYWTDLNAVAEALDLRDFVLMGLSMGGRNAISYAANHPGRVKALVVVDSAPIMEKAGSERMQRFVQGDDELDSVDAFVKRVQEYNPLRPAEQIRGSIMHNLKQLRNGNWTWKYDKVLRSPNRKPPSRDYTALLWEQIDKLDSPTLVVRGGQSDMIALDTADELHRRIKGSSLATVERAGHLVMGDNPSGFESAVMEFIDGVE
jgi:pimeloyl-ACP methyl ester carboxylesterase